MLYLAFQGIYKYSFQCMASDETELEVVENYLKENKLSDTATFEYENWISSCWTHCSEYKQIHLQLNRDIVTWGQKGVDDVSELLACLLILFSQEDGAHFSYKVGQLFEGWRLVIRDHWSMNYIVMFFRFILWRYLESLPWEAKEELFMGALEMLGVARQIWRVEQCYISETGDLTYNLFLMCPLGFLCDKISCIPFGWWK